MRILKFDPHGLIIGEFVRPWVAGSRLIERDGGKFRERPYGLKAVI